MNDKNTKNKILITITLNSLHQLNNIKSLLIAMYNIQINDTGIMVYKPLETISDQTL